MKKTKFIFAFFYLLLNLLNAQTVLYQRVDSVIVQSNNGNMLFPWVGGLNNPQFSEIDLNNDGKMDLFIFDKSGNKSLTFINNGTTGIIDYSYAPQYEEKFPQLENWALLRDFDGDSIMDIFSSRPNVYIKVHKGKLDSNNNLSFDLFTNQLNYQANSSVQPIQVTTIDIPSIIDVNEDGDMDILTFDLLSGSYLVQFENQSIELFGNNDTLFFDNIIDCWGFFRENALTNSVKLDDTCSTFKNSLHTGSTTLALDMNGDNAKDLIIGDVSFSSMVGLTNGGTYNGNATIISQDTIFPSNSKAIDINLFPAAFAIDINNDGLQDLLAAPNAEFTSNIHNVWRYNNIGTSSNTIFDFQEDSFLVKDMIDVGEGSNPAFFDYNADGLLDIIIGNYNSSMNSITESGLTLFENIGDSTHPAFKLITYDYANIKSYSVLGLYPTFGDLDNDGDEDMILGNAGGGGVQDGTLMYFKNTAGVGNTATFTLSDPNYMLIDVGQYSTPQLVDVNRDGLLDLIIGERNGNLNYYENTGTPTTANFNLVSNLWGGVDIREATISGYSTPFLAEIDTSGQYRLLVGNQEGRIYLFDNIEGNLTGTFNQVDSNYSSIDVGSRASLSIADLNKDNSPEILIGNYRGGLSLFQNSDSLYTPLNSSITKIKFLTLYKIYPNPTTGILTIELKEQNLSHSYNIKIYNALGQLVKKAERISNKINTIDVNDLKSGIYFIHLYETNGELTVRKFIKQ